MPRRRFILLFVLILLLGSETTHCLAQTAQTYRYARLGDKADASPQPQPGFALMGGGADLDEAFTWLCTRSHGGDLLVLRATGSDDYNPYIQKLCKLNSVATLIIPSRTAAEDPFVAQAIDHASAIFIAGGDQANYINFWSNTPVEVALNKSISRGVPIGGTSAGLAVLGEFAYSAQGDKPDDPNLDGKTAMADPFGKRVSLVSEFLAIPALKNIITDTHFAHRDRMGRLVTFVARLNAENNNTQPLSIRGLGVEERAAVLLEPDGRATVVGHGSAYCVSLSEPPTVMSRAKPLTVHGVLVQKVESGHTFNLKTRTGDASHYKLDVDAGYLKSQQRGGAVY